MSELKRAVIRATDDAGRSEEVVLEYESPPSPRLWSRFVFEHTRASAVDRVLSMDPDGEELEADERLSSVEVTIKYGRKLVRSINGEPATEEALDAINPAHLWKLGHHVFQRDGGARLDMGKYETSLDSTEPGESATSSRQHARTSSASGASGGTSSVESAPPKSSVCPT